MAETYPEFGAEYDAHFLASLARQGHAVDGLLLGRRDEVYGVTTWEPIPGQNSPVIFAAARDGLLAVYHYGLRVYDGFPSWLQHTAHRGLSWTKLRGQPDPDTIKLHRTQGGSGRTTPLPPVESVMPFLSLALGQAQIFDPDIERVKLEDGQPVIVAHARRTRALRALGRLTGLVD
jgi:hypothetical protein